MDEIFSLVFKYLFAPQILAASEVCVNWKAICKSRIANWHWNFEETYALWPETISSILYIGEFKMSCEFIWSIQSRELYKRRWVDVLVKSSCSYHLSTYLPWFTTLPNFMFGRAKVTFPWLWASGVPVSEWSVYSSPVHTLKWSKLAIDKNTCQKRMIEAFDYFIKTKNPDQLSNQSVLYAFDRVWKEPQQYLEFLEHVSGTRGFSAVISARYYGGLTVETLRKLCSNEKNEGHMLFVDAPMPASEMLLNVLQETNKISLGWWVERFESAMIGQGNPPLVLILRYLVKYRLIFNVISESFVWMSSQNIYPRPISYQSGAIEVQGVFTPADRCEFLECVDKLLPVIQFPSAFKIITYLFNPEPVPRGVFRNYPKGMKLEEVYSRQRAALEKRFPIEIPPK